MLLDWQSINDNKPMPMLDACKKILRNSIVVWSILIALGRMAAYIYLCLNFLFLMSHKFFFEFWWAVELLSRMQAFVSGERDSQRFQCAVLLLSWMRAVVLGKKDSQHFWCAVVLLSRMQAFVLGERDSWRFWCAVVLLSWMQAFILEERDCWCFWWAAELLSRMWAFVLGERYSWCFWCARESLFIMQAFALGKRDSRYFLCSAAWIFDMQAFLSGERDSWYNLYSSAWIFNMQAFLLDERESWCFWCAVVLLSWMRAFESGKRLLCFSIILQHRSSGIRQERFMICLNMVLYLRRYLCSDNGRNHMPLSTIHLKSCQKCFVFSVCPFAFIWLWCKDFCIWKY